MSDPEPSAATVQREAVIQRMREALEGAYCALFNGSDPGDETLDEVIDVCGAADAVGIRTGDNRAIVNARVHRVAGIIASGVTHEMSSLTIARAVVAALDAG